MSEASDGDVVFHYYKPSEAIVAHSIVRGQPWPDEIVWGAGGQVRVIGTYSRTPGRFRRALQHFTLLDHPVSPEIGETNDEVLAIRHALEERFDQPIYFPFYSHGGTLRPTQGYFLKFPASLLGPLELPEVCPISEV